jgi:hemerythrin superfamily protein
MSFIDRIAAAVTPAASDHARAEARRLAEVKATSEPWLGAVLDHHKRIERLITEVRNANNPQDRRWGVRELAQLLTAHSMAEEAVLYPDISEYESKTHAGMAYEEHSMTKIQLAKLEKLDPMSEEFQEKLGHIEGALQQHMYQEEGTWLPALCDKLPPDEKSRMSERFMEEFNHYQSGGKLQIDETHRRTTHADWGSSSGHALQAMPHDGRPGAPDGVNTQGEWGSSDGSDAGAPYPNPHTGKSDAERKDFANTLMGHGGQSTMGYHGSGQLGDQELKPGGNTNSGSKGD